MSYYNPIFDVMDPYATAGYGFDIPYGGGSGYSMEDAYRRMGLTPPDKNPQYAANLRKSLNKAEVALGLTDVAAAQTKAIQSVLPQGPLPAKGGGMMKVSRFAGNALKNPLVQTGLKWAGPAAAALTVGDVLLGDESFGNKAMDAGFMTAGGVLGSAVPIVGTGLGIAAGKMVSDGTQWLFGDKKTPEQRKMELALAQLQGGGMV